MKDNREHCYVSPLWVAHTEKQVYGNREFNRAFLVPNKDITDIQALTFSFTGEAGTLEQVTLDIKPITNTEVKHALFGAMVEVPYTLKDQPYEMRLVEIILGERAIDLRDELWGPLHFEKAFEEDKKNRFLQKYRNHYAQMPVITEQYWQCSCMKYNPLTLDHCENCDFTFDLNKTMIEWGIARIALFQYQKAFPIQGLPGTNFKAVWAKYSKELKEAIDVDDAFLLSEDTQKKCREQFIAQVAEMTRIKWPKPTIVFKGLGLFVFAMLALQMGIVSSHYLDGINDMKAGNYDAAIEEFESIGGALDVEALIDETYYLAAKDLIKDNKASAVFLLEELAQKDYKDSKALYEDMVYEYASDLFAEGKYKEAAELYIKVDIRDSKTQYREAYYRLANELILDPNTYPQALVAINKIAKMDYKDASTLANEWQFQKAQEYQSLGKIESAIGIYQALGTYKDSNEIFITLAYTEGLERYNTQEYSGAISYLQLAGNVKDAPQKLIDATYRLAMDYYNQEAYYEAYTHLNKIPEYKDAKKLINRIEDVVYRWDVTIYFNNEENGISDKAQIRREDPFFIHFSTSGGMPNQAIEPKVVWTFPDGDTDVEIFGDVYTDENNWVGWDTGLFVDPELATTGTFYVSIYDIKTGKLLASDSVELIK